MDQTLDCNGNQDILLPYGQRKLWDALKSARVLQIVHSFFDAKKEKKEKKLQPLLTRRCTSLFK